MSGLELNKIVAAILLSSLVAMMVGFVANVLYKPDLHPKQRGYSVAVTETESNTQTPKEDFKIDVAALMKNANAENGKNLARKCLSCHTLDKGAPNKIGPNLWNVFGAEKAKKDGYKYSTALSSKGGVWDEDSLFHFLHKPMQFAPGTKMSFVGFSKPEDIADVVAFLKSMEHD